jgi:hypothetical protein
MPWITIEQYNTEAEALGTLVEDFSNVMHADLDKKLGEGRSGWDEPEAREQFIAEALVHINRGDWIGAANFCAFLWNLGWDQKRIGQLRPGQVPPPPKGGSDAAGK